MAAERGPGLHDAAAARTRRAGRVGRDRGRRAAEGLPDHRGRYGRAGRLAADPARPVLAAPGRAGHEGPGRHPGARGRRARGHPGPPPLPGAADAAVDADQRGRGRVRPEPGPGRRRRAVPARRRRPLAGQPPTAGSSGPPPIRHRHRHPLQVRCRDGARGCGDDRAHGGSRKETGMAILELRGVSKTYGEGAAAGQGAGRGRPGGRGRSDGGGDGPERLGQVHPAHHRRQPGGARPRRGPGRPARRCPSCRAATRPGCAGARSGTCSRTSTCCPG